MMKLDIIFDQQRAQKADVATDAAALLATWRRLERSHLPVSFGCSCGTLGHVRVQDFELDVLDYLREKHAHAHEVAALLQRFAGQDNRRAGIGTLLQGIANDVGDIESTAKQQILVDLHRSITSWTGALGPIV